MSLKKLKEPRHITAGAWSGLAAPAVAGAAVHSTAPWYVAVPVVVAALGSRSGAGAAGVAGRPGGDRPVDRRQAWDAAMGRGQLPQSVLSANLVFQELAERRPRQRRERPGGPP